MTKQLSESISKIRSLSPKLNSAVHEANQVVQLIEQFLNDECKAGLACNVNVWTKMPEGAYHADPDDYEGMWLGYERIGGKFRIVIDENTKGWDEAEQKDIIERSKTPWSDAPKGQKLDSFSLLPDLLKSIASRIEKSIQSTTETAKTVNEILDALNQPRADDDPDAIALMAKFLNATDADAGRIANLIRAGEIDQAIKEYRIIAKISLAESKATIDEVARRVTIQNRN